MLLLCREHHPAFILFVLLKVTLNYPSCGKYYSALLDKDLESLGKSLARRGSYKQIAAAAFRCHPLKNCLIMKTLDSLAKECNELCSRKKPSLLRKSDMAEFSLRKLCLEWKERAPLFFGFLMTCATSRDKGHDWLPGVAVAGSVLLKERNVHMNATASLFSVVARQSGIQVINNH